MSVREIVSSVVKHFSRTNVDTWRGHALQGVIFTLPFSVLAEIFGNPLVHLFGLTFVVGAFFHRELDNFVQPLIDHGWKNAVRKLKVDGIADFMAPYAASCTTIVVTALVFLFIRALS